MCIVCGEEFWKGDILVADMEELENFGPVRNPCSETCKGDYDETFIFPIADGTVRLSGGDEGIRKSTLTRDQPVRGEELSGDLRVGRVSADGHKDG